MEIRAALLFCIAFLYTSQTCWGYVVEYVWTCNIFQSIRGTSTHESCLRFLSIKLISQVILCHLCAWSRLVYWSTNFSKHWKRTVVESSDLHVDTTIIHAARRIFTTALSFCLEATSLRYRLWRRSSFPLITFLARVRFNHADTFEKRRRLVILVTDFLLAMIFQAWLVLVQPHTRRHIASHLARSLTSQAAWRARTPYNLVSFRLRLSFRRRY